MSDLVQAFASNDILKAKKIFNENMSQLVKHILDEEKNKIAKSIVIEAEESDEDSEKNKKKKSNEDNSDDSEDDDEEE